MPSIRSCNNRRRRARLKADARHAFNVAEDRRVEADIARLAFASKARGLTRRGLILLEN